MTGLAASTKYQMALAAVVIALAHVLHWRRTSLRASGRLLWSAVWTIAAFLLASPYIVLAFGEFRAGLLFQLTDYAGGEHGEISGAFPVRFYAQFLWERGVGPWGCVAAVLGSVVLWRRRDARLWLWWSFILVLLAVFLAQGNHWSRNVMAVQLPLFVLAGIGARAVVQWLPHRLPRLVPITVSAALLAALLLPTGVDAVRYTRRLANGDTRQQLMRWIEQHVPPGERVAAELKTLPGETESRWSQVEYLPKHPPSWYRQNGYSYAVASSDTWRQWPVPAAYTAWATPIAMLGGDDPLAMLGPRLVIYATGLAPADVPTPLPNVQIGGTRLLGVSLGTPDGEQPLVGIVPTRRFRPGELMALRSWWQVDTPFDRDYLVFVHLLDATGNRPTQRDTPPWQGRFPTTTWQPGSLVVDVNDLALPATLAPGSYALVMGLFDPVSGTTPAVSVNGTTQNGPVPIATIEVVAP